MPTSEDNKKEKQPQEDKSAKAVAENITDQNRKDWNDYYSYLKKNNLSGSDKLDAGNGNDNAGIKQLQTYIKSNPNTSLTPELIPAIQKDFSNYRQFALNDIKSGHSAFGDGVNEDNFMKELSVVDGLPGSKTTKHFFPERYMNEMNKGFAKTGESAMNVYK